MIKPRQPGNIQIVDLLRSLSILVVLVSHFAYFAPEPSPFFKGMWSTLRSEGRPAVTVFFVVSGFLITRIIDRSPGGLFQFKPSWFYVRRAGRILPLFFLQIIIGVGFIGFAGFLAGDHSLEFFRCFKLPHDPFDLTFWSSLMTLISFSWTSNFLKTNWMGLGLHWSLFWSLAIEEQFYICYPMLLKASRRKKVIAGVLTTLVFLCWGVSWLGSWLTPPSALPVFTWSDVWCYGAIAMGALLYLLCEEVGPYLLRQTLWNWTAVGTGGLAILTGGTNFFNEASGILNTPLIDLGVFLVLLGGIHLPLFESRWLKLFALPGKYCYGIYLLHVVVIYLMLPVFKNLSGFVNVFLLFGLYTLAVTSIAVLSYRYFEMPANRSIQKKFG